MCGGGAKLILHEHHSLVTSNRAGHEHRPQPISSPPPSLTPTPFPLTIPSFKTIAALLRVTPTHTACQTRCICRHLSTPTCNFLVLSTSEKSSTEFPPSRADTDPAGSFIMAKISSTVLETRELIGHNHSDYFQDYQIALKSGSRCNQVIK